MQILSRRVPRVAPLLIVLLAAITVPPVNSQEPKPKLPPGLIRGPSQEILAMCIQGRGLRNRGDRDAALAIFEEALQKARDKGDRSGEAWAMNNIASVYRYEGKDQKAAEHSQRATALYDQARIFSIQIGDKHNEAYATLYLGVLAAQREEVEQAMKLYETALPLFKEVEDPYYVARTFAFMGQATLHQKKLPMEALPFFEQALPNFREVEKWDEAAVVLREIMTAYATLAGAPPPQPNANKN
jgi:tetratricopeptide (TPR) repeat protein